MYICKCNTGAMLANTRTELLTSGALQPIAKPAASKNPSKSDPTSDRIGEKGGKVKKAKTLKFALVAVPTTMASSDEDRAESMRAFLTDKLSEEVRLLV